MHIGFYKSIDHILLNYVKVIGIYHVNMRQSESMETEHMDFLWVHWFGRDLDHKGGFKTRRLHCIGLTDSKDSSFYGFLNPGDVLQGVHLIPAFYPNQISKCSEVDNSNNATSVQEYYYVSMYVTHFIHLHRH